MTPREAKATLRRRARAARAALWPSVRLAAHGAIVRHLHDVAANLGAHTVATYAATPTEADASRFVAALIRGGGQALWPRVVGPGRLSWHALAGPGELATGYRGIREPGSEAPARALDGSVELLLVPGVAFDRLGRRVGQGGGFYDRVLQACLGPSPLTVGVAYAAQVIPEVPAEPHDVAVDLVVTDRGVAAAGRWWADADAAMQALESRSAVC